MQRRISCVMSSEGRSRPKLRAAFQLLGAWALVGAQNGRVVSVRVYVVGGRVRRMVRSCLAGPVYCGGSILSRSARAP